MIDRFCEVGLLGSPQLHVHPSLDTTGAESVGGL